MIINSIGKKQIMKKNWIILLFLILFPLESYSEIFKFDSSYLLFENKSWVSPFIFYNYTFVTLVSDNEATIDFGSKHGVQPGFIYDIFHGNKNKPDARICINIVNKYTSNGYYLTKPKYVDSISPGDKAIFTNLIETKENQSFFNRIEKELNSKISLIDKDLCFIDITKKNGVQKGQLLKVYNDKKNIIGEIEIIEPVEAGASIAIVKNQIEQFKIGYEIRKDKYSASDWLEIARRLAREEATLKDAVFAYEKAIKLGADPSSFSGELGNIILVIAQKQEKEGELGRALFYWNMCIKYNSLCEENYKFLIPKVIDSGKILWERKEWIDVIKNFENLPKSEEIGKYLSASYNFLGKEVESKNHQMAIYCYEQSFKISSKNIFALKNLANIYFQDILFDKALFWLAKIKDISTREDEKNWADIRKDEISRARENLVPNYSFTSFSGTDFNLDSLKGNIILLVLWNKQNFSSKSEIDYLKFFYENYKNKKFKILAIHSTRDTNLVRSYQQETEGIDFDIVFGNNEMTFLFPEADTLPQNVILDKKGKIVYQKASFDENELKNIVDALLLE